VAEKLTPRSASRSAPGTVMSVRFQRAGGDDDRADERKLLSIADHTSRRPDRSPPTSATGPPVKPKLAQLIQTKRSRILRVRSAPGSPG
jgi:hypothetical protein